MSVRLIVSCKLARPIFNRLPHVLQHFASVCVQRSCCLVQNSMKTVLLFVKEQDNFILVVPQGHPESHTIHEVDVNDKVLMIKMFC